jgi:HEAT repeat protein
LPDLKTLLAELEAEDEKTRAFAAEDIAYDGLVDGITALNERLLIEESRFVKEVIVQSLKIMGEQVIPEVLPLLHSDDVFVRNAAIDILSAHGDNTLEAIEKIMNDKDKDVRKFALDVLIQLGSTGAAGPIARALNDSDINNQITAVEYLGRLEYKEETGIINHLLLATDNLLLRCTCLEALACVGDEETMELVARLYPDHESISLLEQYSFLKYVASKGADIHLELLTALIAEKGQLMHKEIINAIEGILRRRGGRMIPPDLLATLKDYLNTNLNDINKYELLVLLGHYQNGEIFPLLVNHLVPALPLVCLGAVEALGIYGRAEAQPYLLTVRSQTTDEELLDVIARALDQLG